MKFLPQAIVALSAIPLTTSHNHHDPNRELRPAHHIIHAYGKVYEDENQWAQSKEFQENGGACHTRDATTDEIHESNVRVKEWEATHKCEDVGLANPKCRDETTTGRMLQSVTAVQVDTYFHVIRDASGNGIGGDDVAASMDVLNAAYAPDFYFDLKETTYTTNQAYYDAPSSGDDEMKGELREGDCSTLNIYANKASGYLGYATFPSWCAGDTTGDGVVILDTSVPGGSMASYNEGDTLVHEVGHWLGLWHTFQGGCSGVGDEIDDTPAEKSPNYGDCSGPVRDTCPGGGVDPVYNFMDYSDDSCMNEFTSDQRTRMLSQWDSYRGSLPPQPPTPTPPPTMPPHLNCNSDEAVLLIEIKTDNYGAETNWNVQNSCTEEEVLAKDEDYGNNQEYSQDVCVEKNREYLFTITDTYGDGICCNYGTGFYKIKFDGSYLIDNGGEFGSADTFSWGECDVTPPPVTPPTTPPVTPPPTTLPPTTLPPTTPPPTTVAPVTNAPVTNAPVTNAPVTPSPTTGATSITTFNYTEIFFNDFESPNKWGNFNKGGSHAGRNKRWTHAFTGVASLFIRHGSGTDSSIFSDSFDVSGFSDIHVRFMYKAKAVEAGDGFALEYSVDGGNTYSTVQTWRHGVDFNNGVYYGMVETIVIKDSYENMKIRFIGLGDERNDKIFIDDVMVEGV